MKWPTDQDHFSDLIKSVGELEHIYGILSESCTLLAETVLRGQQSLFHQAAGMMIDELAHLLSVLSRMAELSEHDVRLALAKYQFTMEEASEEVEVPRSDRPAITRDSEPGE